MFRHFNRGVAIAILSVAVGGVAVPAIVAAQSGSRTGNPTVAQGQNRGDGFKQLNLSPDQKNQLKTLREKAKQDILNVLSQEQRTKLATAMQSGDRKGVWKTLNLSADQKRQIGEIRKNAKTQGLAILTPEQRTQLEQMRAERRGK
jgi:periplasmic protein CpxP/Spy